MRTARPHSHFEVALELRECNGAHEGLVAISLTATGRCIFKGDVVVVGGIKTVMVMMMTKLITMDNDNDNNDNNEMRTNGYCALRARFFIQA
jgi:hypothetical protein